jgi:hypothetical protein
MVKFHVTLRKISEKKYNIVDEIIIPIQEVIDYVFKPMKEKIPKPVKKSKGNVKKHFNLEYIQIRNRKSN